MSLLKSPFRKEEESLAEECSQVGTPYEAPSAFEDKKETKKRRNRLRYAINKLKDPAAHAAKLAERKRRRLEDPAAHAAKLAERKRRVWRTLTAHAAKLAERKRSSS
ncbi:hypothetical protein THAOC_20170, partial [Thalassiosira oceanica]